MPLVRAALNSYLLELPAIQNKGKIVADITSDMTFNIRGPIIINDSTLTYNSIMGDTSDWSSSNPTPPTSPLTPNEPELVSFSTYGNHNVIIIILNQITSNSGFFLICSSLEVFTQ